jgi:transcriptional regulator with XRE-family HTH domain
MTTIATTDPIAEAFCEMARLLHKMRLRQGWSQEDLAARTGVPIETIAAYEADPTVLTEETTLQVVEGMPREAEDRAPSTTSTGSASPKAWLEAQMEGRMLEMEAALAIDKGNPGEALRLLDRALALGPNAELEGEILFCKAEVAAELGYEEQALALLVEAQRSVDVAADPKLWLRMQLERLRLLCQLERFGDAEALEAQTLVVAAAAGEDRDQIEMRCLRGRIAAGVGRAEEALPLLQQVRAELAAARRTGDSVAVALDLAAVWIEQQDAEGLAAVAALARDLDRLSRNKKLGSTLRSRIKVFCWSVRGERLDAERTRELAREVRRGRRLRRPYALPVRKR